MDHGEIFIQSLGASGLGTLIVAIVLVVLVLLFVLISNMLRKNHKEASAEVVPQSTEPALPASPQWDGRMHLVDVEDREAALIMAIVSFESQIPLNELRFKSIKRVSAEE